MAASKAALGLDRASTGARVEWFGHLIKALRFDSPNDVDKVAVECGETATQPDVCRIGHQEGCQNDIGGAINGKDSDSQARGHARSDQIEHETYAWGIVVAPSHMTGNMTLSKCLLGYLLCSLCSTKGTTAPSGNPRYSH